MIEQSHIREIGKVADIDGDGCINYEEFYGMMTSAGRLESFVQFFEIYLLSQPNLNQLQPRNQKI